MQCGIFINPGVELDTNVELHAVSDKRMTSMCVHKKESSNYSLRSVSLCNQGKLCTLQQCVTSARERQQKSARIPVTAWILAPCEIETYPLRQLRRNLSNKRRRTTIRPLRLLLLRTAKKAACLSHFPSSTTNASAKSCLPPDPNTGKTSTRTESSFGRFQRAAKTTTGCSLWISGKEI